MKRFIVLFIIIVLFGPKWSETRQFGRFSVKDDAEIDENPSATENTIETFMDLVTQAGFTPEKHQVETEDGYLLGLHRITPTAFGKPVVLLLHPLMGASDIWVFRGPSYDFSYLLLDNGYDVWAMNARGNYYSKKHKRMSPTEPKFWEFSWHEIGFYDIPANIDYILSLTKQSQLSLVGHSMGGTAELVFLSQRPEYKAKINVAVAWAPVGIVTHIFPGVIPNIIFRFGNQIDILLKLMNFNEVFPRLHRNIQDIVDSLSDVCQTDTIRKICIQSIERIFGVTDFGHIDMTILPRLTRHYPQGTSLQTFSHYRQIINSGHFRQFDYGPLRNIVRYKRASPPEYKLNKISSPLVIYYGPDDHMSTEKDVKEMVKIIPGAIAREVPHPEFGHLDFITFNETGRLLYYDVLEILNYYNYYNEPSVNAISNN